MKIYVAGASAEIEHIESIIAKLKAAGHTITHDWTVDVRAAGDASPDDDGVRERAALADLRGVVSSDLTWVRQPENPSTGAWVELGCALVMKEGGFPLERRPLLVVSGSSRKCIFSDLADHRFTRHEDALEFVLGLAK